MLTINEDIQHLSERLTRQESHPAVLSGLREGRHEVIDPADLIRVYSQSGKVFAQSTKGIYQLRFRLYEMEEKLDAARFIRISNSEIIAIAQIARFDLSFAGTICIELKNGEKTYVSRRYMPALKAVLGLGSRQERN